MKLLARFDRRFLVVAAILLIGTMFAIVQMVRALTSDRETPVYENTPPAAFAPPPGDTLVKAADLTSPRLPDEDFKVLTRLTRTLTEAAIAGRLTASQLKDSGLPAREAEFMASQANTFRNVTYGREIINFQEPALRTATPTEVEFITSVDFGSAEDGSPPISGSSNASFQLTGGSHWRLLSFTAGLSGGASYRTSPSPPAGDSE